MFNTYLSNVGVIDLIILFTILPINIKFVDLLSFLNKLFAVNDSLNHIILSLADNII